MSTFGRVVLGLILVLELALGGLVYRMIDDVKLRHQESARDLLTDTAHLLATLLASELRDGTLRTDSIAWAMPDLRRMFEDRTGARVPQTVDLRVYVTDRSGRVLYDSTGQHQGKDFSARDDVRLTLAGEYGTRTTRDIETDEHSAVLYVAAPIRWQGDSIGVLSVGKPLLGLQPHIEVGRRHLLFVGLAAALAVILMATGLTVWLVRPFGVVVEYLRMVRQRQFLNLPQLGRTTLGVIGAAFDEMRDALSGRQYVQEYVEALTHEIKSPLATIRAGAELLEDPMPPSQRNRFLADIREAVARIQDLIERLLDLAALEKRRGPAGREPIELAPLVGEAIDSLALEAEARKVCIECAVPVHRTVAGERFLLLRALINLLQNALEFSPAGGRVDIGLEEAGQSYEIVIRDQGPGVPAYAEKRVFERFYSLPRPGSDKKSTGLGLSIVRVIAELHHGQVTLGNHPQGGAVARLRLPRA
ncbi:MAG: histidine kinase [Proteobacteria bacterium]|nr:histidine kinase [Pseudomonadota bacterium]